MILAFGDSLTNGFGVGHEFSYPSQIEIKSNHKVINAGVDGEFSSEALIRLPALLEYKPQVVILCHGANDLLNGFSAQELKENLLNMIHLIQNTKVKIVLVGVPDFTAQDFSTHQLYRELADETDVVLEDEVLTRIAYDDELRNDFVHPNEKGYEMMANAFIEILEV